MSILEEAYEAYSYQKVEREKEKYEFDSFINSLLEILDFESFELTINSDIIENLRKPIRYCLTPPGLKCYQSFSSNLSKEITFEFKFQEKLSDVKEIFDFLVSVSKEDYKFYNKRKLLIKKQEIALNLINKTPEESYLHANDKFKEKCNELLSSKIDSEDKLLELYEFSKICFRLLKTPEVYYFAHHFDYVRQSETKIRKYEQIEKLYIDLYVSLKSFSLISSKNLSKEVEKINFLFFDNRNLIRKFELQ